MKRIPFSEVLENASVDIKREYDRLYAMFYIHKIPTDSLWDVCAKNFLRVPFRGTCITLDDFDDFHKIAFEKSPAQFDVDYLVSFCEYSYNLVLYSQNGYDFVPMMGMISPLQLYMNQVRKVIELIGYTENLQDGVTDFVPKNAEVIIAAKSVNDAKVSYDILEFNHHSMKGNLEEKRKALCSFANYFEQKRGELKRFNKDFENNLFTMFNNFNIRHDNDGNNPLLENTSNEKLEEYYDITYELCLTAFSIIGGADSNRKAKDLRTNIGK